MIKRSSKQHILLSVFILVCMLLQSVYAQERTLFGTHTLYDDVYNPQRSHFTDSNTYLGFSIIPGLAGTSITAATDGPFFNQFAKTKTFANDSVDNQYLINNFGTMNNLQLDLKLQLFLLKIRLSAKHKGEFSFATRANVAADFNIRTEFLALPLVGNASFVGKTQDGFFNNSTSVTVNAQASMGYRMNVAKGLGMGVLVSMYQSPFSYDLAVDSSYLKMRTLDEGAGIEAFVKGSIVVVGTGVPEVQRFIAGDTTMTISVLQEKLIKDLSTAARTLKNTGYGISFGGDYDINKRLNVTVGVRNVGWITYNQGGKLYTLKKTLRFDTIPFAKEGQDSLIKEITNFKNYAVDSVEIKKAYKYTPSSFIFGASYKLLPFIVLRGFINYQLFDNKLIYNRSLNFYKDFKNVGNNRLIEYTGLLDIKLGASNFIFNYGINNTNSVIAGFQYVFRSKHFDYFLGFEQLGGAAQVAGQLFLEPQYQKYVPSIGFTPGLNVNFGMAFRIGANTPYQRQQKAERKAAKRVVYTVALPSQELLEDSMIVDSDGDGILDHLDDCPEVKGELDNKGCPYPDSDGDGVVDKYDACPDVFGLKERNGCPIPDTDGDGLKDDKDKCPNEVGPIDNDGCPLPDTDGDGVTDNIDKCPAEFGLADNDGCPLAQTIIPVDSDNDGVVDSLDKCPSEFGLSTNQGCPEEKKVAILTREETKVMSTVFQNLVFETGKAVIDPVSYTSLESLVNLLNANQVFIILIEGHTDNSGKKKSNLKLSQARANAVGDYLKAKGIKADRIRTKGFGDTRPMVKNDTKEHKAKNRRVEFTVVTK